MTVQQEAISMIKSMPDDTVIILVELLKRMKKNDSYSGDLRMSGDGLIQSQKRRLGIADGRYYIPDNIDLCNDEIAKMFGGAEE
ncbi:MAG: hypothetical protein Q4A32_06040 [Lachnospiraceae bacterium]|nr:hypothetical protein [Lachnospiraceae bacterium]